MKYWFQIVVGGAVLLCLGAGLWARKHPGWGQPNDYFVCAALCAFILIAVSLANK
jgi:hypothetical protein